MQQLGLFDAPPAPPSPVARATAAAPALLAKSPNCGTKPAQAIDTDGDGDQAAIAAEHDRLHDVCTRGRQVVEVDPKRLDRGGDIDRSYSAQSLMEKSAVTAPFRLNGADYVDGGGMWWRGNRWCDCYRIVALEAFDGPSAPYAEHDWDRTRGSDLGGYHGMRARHGSRDVVLVGPPIVIVAGQPEQAVLI